MRATIALALALAAATAAPAQLAGGGHVVTVDYAEDQVVPLQVAPGYQLVVELGGDERVENVSVGNSAAWQVTANKRGDHLFVKALGGGGTNMVVVTDRRLYAFDLVPAAGGQTVYALRFRYPPPAGSGGPPMGRTAGRYRLSGDRALRPAAISDDGVHTYMQWATGVTLPAVYVLDGDGHEALANGAMRDGTYVVDSIAARLVFRRDRLIAYADRLRPAKR